ncbi:bifunctional phosphopantothenoylcysteine decarboxylase/phosphopantothenate--cysteine ligase CoaBC [Thermosyntropha sp.]|uniref:bifunctional phosphopantothenoylcysteine decarboxylase/phosphopantothenate--cysteine ligase CoaBC n=1 Tax=Thermosyntropha sp. TaxID=2740820 RepID=UPI0025E363F3|nr:bifunctional phosphopantothenoylcysteine decarboxylase/phosphopantothenate--cysteine ligase CoaBC [Thermosyntropha sp.]MBO8158522.1 bifunctional phosphopantothenoylcysteine decarboxylase/phosphopantothenate--cysteine ligase CoaBC [Thermosyntropha sp.]
MKKTVGVGITGGIASYKIADLVSRLSKDEDINVIVIMTEAATKFITPLTFRTLSGRDVATDLWQESGEWKVQHIGIAEALDLMVIAPATANFIAKMAHGIADDLLSTIMLANTAPVLVVPSMNTNMYENPIVQANLTKLAEYGFEIMNPASGKLACDAVGKGRLPDIEEIYEKIRQMLNDKKDLKGKKVLVNAGTTCEDIDPIRFICNRSTGKMGYAIAREALLRGAEVILVSGRSTLTPPTGVEFIPVWSADEMCEVMLQKQPECDIIIGAAAVGDFKAANKSEIKIKKREHKEDKLLLELTSTPDILKELGKRKKTGQIMVGFAAETNNLLEYARRKLEEKNLDFIVANDVSEEGAGFGSDTNIVTIIDRRGEVKPLPQMSKERVAAAIIDKAVELF